MFCSAPAQARLKPIFRSKLDLDYPRLIYFSNFHDLYYEIEWIMALDLENWMCMF